MQASDAIQALESRAALVGRTLYEICGEAGEDYTLFRAWLKGRPYNSRVFERATTRVSRKLDAIECEVFMALAPRFLPDHILDQLDLASCATAVAGAGRGDGDAANASPRVTGAGTAASPAPATNSSEAA